MKRNNTYLFGTALVFVLLMTATPQGRNLLDSIYSRLGASAIDSSRRYEVTVTLDYDNGDTFEWSAPMNRHEYSDVDFRPKKLSKKYVQQARKALARKMGYSEEIFDNASSLVAVKVQKIEVTDLKTDKSTRLPSLG